MWGVWSDESSFDDDGMELVDEDDGIVNDACDDEGIIDFIVDWTVSSYYGLCLSPFWWPFSRWTWVS